MNPLVVNNKIGLKDEVQVGFSLLLPPGIHRVLSSA